MADNSFTGPLHTDGRWIVDAQGNKVKLASVAVIDFGKTGYHWGQNRQSLQELLDSIKKAGFNSIRLPISIELMLRPIHEKLGNRVYSLHD